MSNQNIVRSVSECELIVPADGNELRIECHRGGLRVIDRAQYVKMNVVTSLACIGYKLTIRVETLDSFEEKEK